MFVIREWSIRTTHVRRTPPLVDTSGDSLRSEGTFHSFAFCQRFARVFLHTSLFVARTCNISWQCPNLEHKCSGIFCLVACERPVVPPCGSRFVFQRVTARFCCSSSSRWKCANICRVGSFPTPFSRARVACSFCNIVTFLCLRCCWMFTVRVSRHLNAMGLCFACTCKLCASRGCWHRGRLFHFYRVVWWRSGYFVSLTMGCVVVTEPFDLTSLAEDTRSPFQIGCKLFFGSICEPTRVGTFVICCRRRHVSEKKARIAVTTHKRIIRGGAVMPFTRCSVPVCRQVVPMSSISFFGVNMRTRSERGQIHQRTCVQESHATCAPDNNTSW